MTDSLLFQIPLQLAVMGALSFVVYGDAFRLRWHRLPHVVLSWPV